MAKRAKRNSVRANLDSYKSMHEEFAALLDRAAAIREPIPAWVDFLERLHDDVEVWLEAAKEDLQR